MRNVPFGGPPARPGTVYLVGAGPGDPSLLSLRAAQLLSTATVVLRDRLVALEPLALCPDGCEILDVGKQPDRHPVPQEEVNRLMVDRAQEGEAVVRYKGGDPFVLGRGAEEAAACAAAGVPFEVVPATTAGIAGLAYAGIPVTHRGVAPGFAVVTGHEDPAKPATQVDYATLAAFPGTRVLYMGGGRLDEIASALVGAGKPANTPAAVVQWATTPRQRTVVGVLSDIADRAARAAVPNPALIVVGDVVGLRAQLRWFDRRPLHGRTVLVPRTRQQASALSERLRALGAEPVEAPTIVLAPAPEPEALQKLVAGLGEGAFDWVAFTSANGVEAVWNHVRALGRDSRLLAPVRVAAVGPGTAAALAGHGLHADLVARPATTQALADALVSTGAGQRVLLPRADLATPVLAETLVEAGWTVTEADAYHLRRAEALPSGVADGLRDGSIDAVALASSSTARNLVELLGGLPHPDVRVASIGPVTTEACRDLGMRVDAEADPHDLDGLVAAVARGPAGRAPQVVE
jgi:uroporphyrinogen III methyltransferase / synthase